MRSILPLLLLLGFATPGTSAQAETTPDAWEQATEALAPERRDALAFVLEHMPAHDREGLDAAKVSDQVDLAFEARETVAWGDALPEALFLNEVVAPSHWNERRDLMRRELAAKYLERVAALESSGQAALYLNKHLFGELGVRYSTKRRRADQGPRETIETGLASCTGLSILLAETARACGIPARLAGIHTWPNKSGNHTWVEVWDTADGKWHHVGAAEPDDRGLDHVWFAGDAAQAIVGSRENGIWAASYARTEHLFPLVWLPQQDYVFAVDVTARYAPKAEAEATPSTARRVHVEVRGVTGERVAVPVAIQTADVVGTLPLQLASDVTRDEGADTNDFATFELEADVPVRLVVGGIAEDEPLDLGSERELRIVRQLGPSDAELAALLAEDPDAARTRLWEAFASSPEHHELRADFDASRVRTSDRESPWVAKQVGERPEGGWPLVIAMHGGGGVPKEFNDSQWKHMQVYYRDHPEAGGYRYLALRAPNDQWNGFYDDAISPLIERLVLQQVLFADVDADRVHLIGYSHGGYGVWVIAPKIPDRFASAHASAAAPSDGETMLENLFALPFTYMCGEHDTAYGRYERNRAADERLRTLGAGFTDGFSEIEVDGGPIEPAQVPWYPARFEPIPNQGHGGLPDRDKTRDLLHERRDPLPSKLVWLPSDNRIRDHYWLSVDHPRDGQEIRAAVRFGHLELDTKGVDARATTSPATPRAPSSLALCRGWATL